MSARVTWLLIGAVAGGVLAIVLFAEPLCKAGVSSKINAGLDSLGLAPDSKLRGIVGDFVNG